MRQRIVIGVLVLVTAICAVGQEASQPATPSAPTNQERLNDLLALIEGQNTPEGRRTIVRELLLQRWPETTPRLLSLLNGTNGPAKIAVATVLADLPQFLDPVYVEPLIAMLADADPAVRQAAAGALAAYPNNGVTTRLLRLALDREQPRPARLAAIAALGSMTNHDAVEGLVAVLNDPDPGIAQAGLTALSQATAMEFNETGAARAWWDESSALPREAWQQLQIDRLVRKDRETHRRQEALETRLAKALEASFLRAPDAERVTLLAGYLADASSMVRLTGLRLAQMQLAEGKSLPAELQDRIRDLLNSPEPREQAAAVQTVASLRDPRDAERFMAMLETTRSREVRLALLNGLGYVGTGAVAELLLRVLDEPDEPCAAEAVAALGRLAERGVLDAELRDKVAVALLRAFDKTQPSQAARERVLWAMGNLADVRFGATFVAALERRENVAVRLAAVRGIASLKNPQLGDALAEAVSDPDPAVRKAAIETLAQLGSSGSDKQVQALWERVISPQETDETVRQLAWRSVLEILSKGPTEDLERWIARLPGNTVQDTQRRVELLGNLAQILQQTEPVDRGRLGLIRARLAAQCVRLAQPAEAVSAYVAALDDLHAAKAEAVHRVALELIRYALLNSRYDNTVAEALAGAVPATAERNLLWQAAKAEVEARLTPAGVDQALAMLMALEQHPPGAWPAEALQELAQLRARAVQMKPPATASAPAIPASAPASRPDAQ
jgi:HEAT repeat protein